ncbi:MAG: ATP-binding cassette domain-containing protein [Ostreibacterium sp.]
MYNPILSIQKVEKSFPDVKALSNVSLDVFSGEVVSIVGENGAGKSTLLKILSGDYKLDKGYIGLKGIDCSHVNPLSAHQAGFRLVRQEPEIVPYIDVTENVFVGEYIAAHGLIKSAAMRKAVEEMLEHYSFTKIIDLNLKGYQLSPCTDAYRRNFAGIATWC